MSHRVMVRDGVDNVSHFRHIFSIHHNKGLHDLGTELKRLSCSRELSGDLARITGDVDPSEKRSTAAIQRWFVWSGAMSPVVL